MKWFRRAGFGAVALVAATIAGRGELAPYLQNIEGGNLLDAIFFQAGARRAPVVTRPELSKLIAAKPGDAELIWLRAMEAEKQLDFAAAESDWIRYADLATDKAAGEIALADYYHRRLEPGKELTALDRSGNSFERALRLIDEQLLGYEAARREFRAWIAAEPKQVAPYTRFFEYALAHKEFADAEQAMKQYAAAFPGDAVFPVRGQAEMARSRGSAESALAVYDRAFQPLWPQELVKSYFELLKQTGSLRRYLEAARAGVASNPESLEAASRIFHYWQQQGRPEQAIRPLIEFESRKAERKTAWTSDQLATLAELYEAANDADRAARAWYSLYASDPERSIAGIAKVLLASAGQGIRFGSGDLSYYRDIAQADPNPGYLNGILSLLLNTTEPSYRYSAENESAEPYFHRARAAELITLFDARFPNSRYRSGLDAKLIQAYSIHGDNAGVIQAGRRFLTSFADSPLYAEVAVAIADAHARRSETAAEFGLYDEVLSKLARTAGGIPLGESAGAGPKPPNAEGQPAEQSQAKPRSPEYARILDRYIARLVALKRVPDAIKLYRREIGKNPSDPGLYERFAAFLEQNKLGADLEETYRRAMTQFQDKSWSHKLARWYLRQKQTAALEKLTKQVVATFSGTELEAYFNQAVPRALAPLLYRQLNLYAHQRFPHNLVFTRNLLTAYTTRGTADPAAYEALLRASWFHADDLRTRFFELLSRTRRLDAELAALGTVNTPAQVNANPAAAMMLAEGEAWRAHHEQAGPVFRAIAASYPASNSQAQRAAAVYRSLATIDPKQTEVASAIAQNLVASEPRSTHALAYAGEIWADRDRFDRARPLWNRIVAAGPGDPDRYLEAATVFWDYFLFDDALRVIDEGRRKLGKPALHAYQAGVIFENQRRYDRALAEYANAVVIDSSSQAQQRIVRLARRPALRDSVEHLTVDLANRSDVRLNALQLRAAVLENQGRRADLEQFLLAAAARTDSLDALGYIQNQANISGIESVMESVARRRVEVTADSVDRLRYQLALAHFYEDRGRNADAERAIASAYSAQPNSLGVVRAAADFYWRTKQSGKAVNTLTEAASRAQPGYQRALRLEASRKATEAGDIARARQVLALLLKDDPYRAEYLSAMADTYARSGDDRGLRTFYINTLDELRASNLTGDEKGERIAAMRRGLIPVLTRMKDFNAALDQYIEIVNRFPDDAGLTREATAYAAANGLADRLIAYYTKTAAEAPRDYRWHTVLARVDAELERFPEAVDAYTRATALRPERSDLWIAQAQLQERLLRFADAEKVYARLFELTYRDPQWMAKVAELRARQGQTDAAEAALRTAYIENRPERADQYLEVARILSGWGNIDAAVKYAEKGAEIAGAELDTDLGSAMQYAAVLTRARRYEAAYRRAPANGAVLPSMSSVVREFYTPEEKIAFAAFLEKAPKPEPRTGMEAAQTAGLQDSAVRQLLAMIRSTTPLDFGLITQFEDIEGRRVRFAELGAQLEAVWRSTPPSENRDQLLVRAMDAYHQAGDAAGELRIIQRKKSSGLDGELSQRFCRLIERDPRATAAVLATDPPEVREMAANCAVQGNRPKEALAAIALRGQGLPPVWTSAYTSLAGLYFPLRTPDVRTAFGAALGSGAIGDQIAKPVNRDVQLAGEPWFYYASRYGEYLALNREPDSAGYLPASIEASPGNAGAYFELAEYYREAGDAARAADRYSDAVELDPNRGDAHERMAVMLWSSGKKDEAVAQWREALQAFARQQDRGSVSTAFGDNVKTALVHIGQNGLLPSLKPDADRLLRTYIRRNGVYQAEALIEGVLSAGGVDWLTELSQASNDPAAILAFAARQSGLPAAQKDVIYSKLIEIERAKAAASSGAPRESAERELHDWRMEFLRSLIERRQADRARALLASIPEKVREARQGEILPLELQVAAQTGTVASVLARVAAAGGPLPLDTLRNGANELMRRGGAGAARTVLEFVYTRELAAHNFDAANFLGLAEIRLEQKDVSAAVALLRRMTMLAGEPFATEMAAGELLARQGHAPEAAEFYARRANAVPWDQDARAKLAALRKDSAALAAVVNEKRAPYAVRADAATALRTNGGAPTATGAAELDLLASNAPLTEAAVNRPYWFPARVAAASATKDPAAKIRLLQGALAVNPDSSAARLDLFRAALDRKRYQLAVASMWTRGMQYGAAPADAAVARSLAEAYRGLNEPLQAQMYYNLALSADPPDRTAIEKELEAVRNAIELRRANEERRPVVTANLEQPHVVRPRLTVGGAR